ncbi:MAG: ABC transporter permease [Collinsella sp.]|nr:ABC transporter permease [Collinsella sp.]
MLCKLAWGNVRRAGKDYLVYLLTLALAVTVFYAFNTISIQIDYADIEKGMSELLGGTIQGLTVFLGAIMGFLLVYANNFIMKRRKKEFGLYQVLGMGRGRVASIMVIETVIVSIAALVLGVLLGVALSQVMVFFTASLFKTKIANFEFFFSVDALFITVACLIATFAVTLIFNLRVVARASIIDLMSSERRSESIKVRNPWISAAVFVVGALAVAIAYVRLNRDGLPYDGSPQGMQDFLITTVTVVIGTVLLFFGLSGFLLKILQSFRGIYWRGLNMFTLRQLSAKVNTVSFSMAVISMILFLAITSVTSGMSIAGTMNGNVDRGTPADYSCTFVYYSEESAARSNDISESNGTGERYVVTTEPVDILKEKGKDLVDPNLPTEHSFDLASIAGETVQLDTRSSVPLGSDDPIVSVKDICAATGAPLPKGLGNADANVLGLAFISESNYNDYLRYRGMEPIDLGDDGYTITCDLGSAVCGIYDSALEQGYPITVGAHTLKPAADRVDVMASSFVNSFMGTNGGTVVVPDKVLEEMPLPMYQSYLLLNYKSDITDEEGNEYIKEARRYGDIFNDSGEIVGLWGVESTRDDAVSAVNSLAGLCSYLAIYIGFVLVVACAAILTIQQLSDVADSSRGFRILSELGSPEKSIKRSVLTQQAVFFAFPLLVALAHSMVALREVSRLVELLGDLEIGSMVGLTGAIFLLAYGGYFGLTYFLGSGIVRDSIRARHAL